MGNDRIAVAIKFYIGNATNLDVVDGVASVEHDVHIDECRTICSPDASDTACDVDVEILGVKVIDLDEVSVDRSGPLA